MGCVPLAMLAVGEKALMVLKRETAAHTLIIQGERESERSAWMRGVQWQMLIVR